jgi:3',5'-cyclic-AMP phosphodiesterase
MIIAQITDLHVVERGRKMQGTVDTNGAAEAAVAHLQSLVPRPDVVLVSGDLCDDGAPAEYEYLREVLDALAMPYYVIPGNHDRRAALLRAFAGHAWASPSGFVQYVVDDHPVRLVALDTLREEREDGLLCGERLAWLEETLAAAPDKPTLIFMHHPPFATGIWWMDASGLSGADELRRIVARNPQVGRIACGHIHRPIQSNWGGTMVSIAPSTSHQVHLDLVPESPPHVVMEPPALYLHAFDGRQFVTHTSFIRWPQKPIDLSEYMGDWDELKAELRVRRAGLR